ncbi:MAG: exodeoxyribonuclease V subunit beta [Sodalis sp. (in: enterobacteria)]
MIAESLNPMSLPLQGTRLIEAAAGTGKTHTLVTLYLRLLLGLGEKAAYPRLLSVKEILVVTFTEGATEELRCRIRKKIHRLRMECLHGKSTEPLLMVQPVDPSLIAIHLLDAEQQMDEAAIYTIHGFCQRMLNQNPLESGILFQYTLVEDESFLRQQVSADFWRRYCYPLPLDVVRMVQQYWQGPENLLTEVLPYLQGDPPLVCNSPDVNESILVRHARIIAGIEDFKRQWRAASKDIRTILDIHKLDRRVYSSKNLLTWLEKIDLWASEKHTINYHVPNELKRFKSSMLTEKSTGCISPHHPLFSAVEGLYQKVFSLRELIFVKAMTEMRQALEQVKQQRSELGFDDLISCFDRALTDGRETLAQAIRTRYPVAMVDEFQDTDSQQYRVFSLIYGNQPTTGLILIGDPKQAIYAFRGADIFTYMRARKEVDANYTLYTNWRSAPGMINAVNQLFQSLPVPFIFNKIPFSPVVSAACNTDLRLFVHGKSQPAMRIWVQPGAFVGVNEYRQYMLRQCAFTIREWLYAAHEGVAWLEGGRQGRKLLQASDITVLVRNRNEAALVQNALAKLMIHTVYLSNQDSVFETPEARELQWILEAVSTPEKDTVLRRALATNLLGFDAESIDALNNDEPRWEGYVEEFNAYRHHWQQNGVLPMLNQMMIKHRIAENLLIKSGGERRLTNLLHLGELLQEASLKLKNKDALVRWLILQVESPNPKAENQKLRLESDRHLVQIITVHKSKGREFPLVFFPFAADFLIQKRPHMFHDRETYEARLDLSASQKSFRLGEEERLSEDLRLLYVALTRSIYHCSLGIAPVYRSSRKKNGNSDVHLSALGYLIQQGEAGDADYLRDRLKTLAADAKGDIALCEAMSVLGPALSIERKEAISLSARRCFSSSHDFWRIISYSALQQHANSVLGDPQPQLNMDGMEKRKEETLNLTPHMFPRGAMPGTFLHSLLKSLNFNRPLDPQWLSDQLATQGMDVVWQPAIMLWLENIITIPLDGGLLSLAHLAPDSLHTELEFYLPINALVKASDLNLLCKRYDPLSARCPLLDFPKVKGMLKGFIDLIFRWGGRYYLLDYKSNWLGEDSFAYTQPAMERAMIDHRYELQYQLYTLALHRFLRHRLVDYDYQRDVGGVYYLFLRGINPAQPGNGIFYCHPDVTLINKLDTLFLGNGNGNGN